MSDADHARYTRQHALMSTIMGEFESERAEDGEEVKRQRFERILDVMQRMQELGHPPKEIVGEIVRAATIRIFFILCLIVYSFSLSVLVLCPLSVLAQVGRFPHDLNLPSLPVFR